MNIRSLLLVTVTALTMTLAQNAKASEVQVATDVTTQVVSAVTPQGVFEVAATAGDNLWAASGNLWAVCKGVSLGLYGLLCQPIINTATAAWANPKGAAVTAATVYAVYKTAQYAGSKICGYSSAATAKFKNRGNRVTTVTTVQ